MNEICRLAHYYDFTEHSSLLIKALLKLYIVLVINLRVYLRCLHSLGGAGLGLVLLACSALADEPPEYLFGKPVIFEAVIAHGKVHHTQINDIAFDSSNYPVSFNPPALDRIAFNDVIFCILPCGHNYRNLAIQPSVFETTMPLAEFDAVTEMGLGVRTQISENTDVNFAFSVSRLESTPAFSSQFRVRGIIETEISGLSNIVPNVAPIYGADSTTTTSVAFGLADVASTIDSAEFYHFEMGLRQKLFPPLSVFGQKLQPFADVGAGLVFVPDVDISMTGSFPDFNDIVRIDGVTTTIFGGSPTVSRSRVLTPNVVTAQTTVPLLRKDIRPEVSLGGGVSMVLSDRTTLSFEYRSKFSTHELSGRTNARFKMRQETIGLRLSRTF